MDLINRKEGKMIDLLESLTGYEIGKKVRMGYKKDRNAFDKAFLFSGKRIKFITLFFINDDRVIVKNVSPYPLPLFYFSVTSTRRAFMVRASFPEVLGSFPSPEVESLAALIPCSTRYFFTASALLSESPSL